MSSSDGHIPAASLGMSFLEALSLLRHVLQVSIPDNLIQDPQLKGRAQRLQPIRDGDHPARSLKAKEAVALERLMLDGLDTWDKYMIGEIVFAFSSRSRWLLVLTGLHLGWRHSACFMWTYQPVLLDPFAVRRVQMAFCARSHALQMRFLSLSIRY